MIGVSWAFRLHRLVNSKVHSARCFLQLLGFWGVGVRSLALFCDYAVELGLEL